MRYQGERSLGRREPWASNVRTLGRPLPDPFLGTLTFVALVGVFPVLIALNTASGGFGSWVGAYMIMMVTGARFAWIIGGRERRLFEMTTWLYFYLFLGAAPMVQLRERADPSTTPGIMHALDGQVVAIVLVSAIAIMLGSAVGQRQAFEGVARPARPVSSRRTTLLTLGVIAFSVFYVARLGPAMLFASRADRGRAADRIFPDATTSTVALAIVSMGLLIAVVAQLAVRRDLTAQGKKRPIFLLALTTVMLFACVNPISMPRFVFGTVLLGYLAALGIYGTVKRFRLTSLGALAGLVFLFPLLDVFRRTLDSTVKFESPFESFKGGDYDSFAQINNTVLHVAESGTAMGMQALGVLFFWVPRGIWPTKPLDTGIVLANDRGYRFTNLSAPLPAEFFINGGWVVLIVGMLAFGFALRRWDAATERNLVLNGVPSVLGCVVPFYMILVLRGSLLQAMAYLSVILVMALLVRGSAPRTGTGSRLSRRSKILSA
jgi:hypothetical protein